MTLAAHEEVVDAEIVRTHTEWAEVIKSDLGRAVEGIVSAGKHLIAAKADVNHGEWLPMLEQIGIDETYARRLMQVSRNPAISNQANLPDLPARFAVLREIARMDPSDVEDGIESGRITPNMKIKDAKAFANDEWPDVPEPTDEERFQQMEAARNQLIAEGIRPAPLTDEDRAAEAREFVESIVGKQRTTEPATPEEKLAKALNTVGAAIRLGQEPDHEALNEDGRTTLRALGLM